MGFWVAGLSLGEYCALVFAGVLGFEDGLRVVKARADSMAAAATLGEPCGPHTCHSGHIALHASAVYTSPAGNHHDVCPPGYCPCTVRARCCMPALKAL